MSPTCPHCSKPKAAVYARISDDQKGERLGVQDQAEDCWARIADEDWCTCDQTADTYTDNDIGASKGKRRPDWERLKEALSAGRYKHLVARDDGRLTRNVHEAYDLVELVEKAKVNVLPLWTEHWDLTTAAGRKRVRDAFSDAQYEAERTGERVARARLREAKAGKPMMGGPRPWGFADNRVGHDPVEAEQVRDAARRLLAGESPRSVAKRVGQQPFNMWRALMSPRMIGYREHKGVRYKATWEPILDTSTWEAIRALHALRDGRAEDVPGGQFPRTHLLSGFLRCGICGSRVNGAPTSRAIGGRNSRRRVTVPGYRCMNIACGNVRRAAEPLDRHVTEWVLELAELPPDRTVDPTLAVKVHEARTLIDGLWQLFEGGAITADEFASKRFDYNQRLAEAEARLSEAHSADPAGLVATVGDTEIVVALWDWWHGEATLHQKRELIARHVDRIVLHPARRGRKFDSEAVEIVPATLAVA